MWVKIVARVSLMEPKEDSSLKDCPMLEGPVVYVPVMFFYLRTFVCCLKEEGRSWGTWSVEKQESNRRYSVIFPHSSHGLFSFHISICSKESRVSGEVEGEGCISTDEIA